MKKIGTLLLFTISYTYAHVLIFTHVYNRPDFIEIQYKTFKAFLQDEYEFVVFSDAPTENMARQIKQMCDKYSIECVRIPPEIHTRPYLQRWPGENNHAPAVRNSNAVMYSLNTRGFDHDDILVLLDSDMFLVKKLNIRNELAGYDMIARKIHNRGSLPHVWQGFIFMDMKTLPNIQTLNFNCGRINNVPVDAGGHTYYYINEHPELKIRYVEQLYSLDFRCAECNRTRRYTCNHMRNELIKADLDEAQAIYFEQSHNSQFFFNQRFLHYRSGSNWEHRDKSYIQQKTNALHTYLKTILP